MAQVKTVRTYLFHQLSPTKRRRRKAVPQEGGGKEAALKGRRRDHHLTELNQSLLSFYFIQIKREWPHHMLGRVWRGWVLGGVLGGEVFGEGGRLECPVSGLVLGCS